MESTKRDEEMANLQSNPGKIWAMNQQIDQPLGPESNRITNMNDGSKGLPMRLLILMSFQSLGIVFGDLGTSTLYVFRSTFPGGFRSSDHREDVLGALSLIIYTFTLIPLIKYMFIVLKADDNGEGGTFALYALLCRHCKFSSLPSSHPSDERLTTYNVKAAKPNSQADSMRKMFEKSKVLQNLLLMLVLLSTCMVIGDGILTPAISVLSAVDGIKAASPKLSQSVVVTISVVILVCLFSLQRFGTGYIGYLFAPIVLLWFLTNGSIGVFNICKYDASVFRAFSPHYGIRYLVKHKRDGWSSLGGVVLCITGSEALYADLGHFSASSIRLAFCGLVYPCALLAYIGQASFLMHHPEHVKETFYKSIPSPLYWPMFVLATIAASIASQAIISATFSIVKQAAALGCFPRVKVVHTSTRAKGQVFISEINWIVMILCVIILASFRDTEQIGYAYGIAVVGVMLSTTLIMFLVMVMVWQKSLFFPLLFLAIFGIMESVYYSAALYKVRQGGWVPLAIAATLVIIMYVWHYGTIKRYNFETQNKVSVGWVLGLAQGLGLVRVPGVGLVYTDLAHGVPPILSHFITNLPAIHSILVFVCIKYLPVNTVPPHERFHVKRIGPKGFSMFRCAARYGYMDLHKKDDDFEQDLMSSLAQYIRFEALGNASTEDSNTPDWTSMSTTASTRRLPRDSSVTINNSQGWPSNYSTSTGTAGTTGGTTVEPTAMQTLNSPGPRPINLSPQADESRNGNSESAGPGSPELQSTAPSTSPSAAQEDLSTLSGPQLRARNDLRNGKRPDAEISIKDENLKELEALQRNSETGVVYILGNVVVRANKNSGIVKKIAINYIYAILKRFCRDSLVIYKLPPESLLQVGMIYRV